MTDPRMTPTNDAPVTVEQGQRWQHVKRGTTYEVLGVSELQCSANAALDGAMIVIYRGDDGKLWSRGIDEFTDGRFRLAALASAPAGVEPFGYWIEQKYAEPVLLRKPAYIPEPSDLRTVTPLYTNPASASAGDAVEAIAEGLREWQIEHNGGVITSGMKREMAACILRQPVFAALARPRAAVGEQSREAIAAIIAKHVTAPEENAIERYRLIFEQERLAAADEIIALKG